MLHLGAVFTVSQEVSPAYAGTYTVARFIGSRGTVVPSVVFHYDPVAEREPNRVALPVKQVAEMIVDGLMHRLH
jgi:hypothetical protein